MAINDSSSYTLRFNEVSQILEYSSGLTWLTVPGLGASVPGGANTQVQFNNAGAFGGSANLTWNGSTLTTTSVTTPLVTNAATVTVSSSGGNVALSSATGAISLSTDGGGGAVTVITSGAFDVFADRGIILPNRTTGQRDAISGPDTGALIMNITTGKLNFYSGVGWEAVTSA